MAPATDYSHGKGPETEWSDEEIEDRRDNPGEWICQSSRNNVEFTVSMKEIVRYREDNMNTWLEDWANGLVVDWSDVDENIAALFLNTCVMIFDLQAEQNCDDDGENAIFSCGKTSQ